MAASKDEKASESCFFRTRKKIASWALAASLLFLLLAPAFHSVALLPSAAWPRCTCCVAPAGRRCHGLLHCEISWDGHLGRVGTMDKLYPLMATAHNKTGNTAPVCRVCSACYTVSAVYIYLCPWSGAVSGGRARFQQWLSGNWQRPLKGNRVSFVPREERGNKKRTNPRSKNIRQNIHQKTKEHKHMASYRTLLLPILHGCTPPAQQCPSCHLGFRQYSPERSKRPERGLAVADLGKKLERRPNVCKNS